MCFGKSTNNPVYGTLTTEAALAGVKGPASSEAIRSSLPLTPALASRSPQAPGAGGGKHPFPFFPAHLQNFRPYPPPLPVKGTSHMVTSFPAQAPGGRKAR